jgi:hypothetical protein
MSKRLLDIYRAILGAGWLAADAEGYISMVAPSGEKKPAMIKGKRLVLPTPEHLKNPDWSDRVPFHPLFENILHGESEVLEKFRQAINIRMNTTIGTICVGLLRLATSTGEHSKLKPEQTEFLSKVKNADEKTLDAMHKLLTAMPATQMQKQFVSIYLKRGGSLAGKKHARVGVVSFPLYKELLKGEDEVYGVKLRKKDLTTLVNLLEYIFPGIEDDGTYSRPSDSKQAPFLDALMHAVAALADPINGVLELFKKPLGLGEFDEFLFSSDWIEAFDNVDALAPEARSIPMLSGNDGHALAPTATAAAPAATTAAAPAPATAGVWQPPVHRPPAYQFQPPAAAPAVSAAAAFTGRGNDLETLIRSNPVLSQQAGAMGYGPQGMVAVRNNSEPRWAQGYGGQGGGWASQGQGWGGGQPQQSWGQPVGGYGGRPNF